MKKIFISTFLLGLLISLRAEAATLYFGPTNLDQKSSSEVGLYLDTEGQEINAVDLNLRFPTDSALIESLSDGGSIIPFWVDKPDFSNNDGRVSFSGIIPGGFSGKGLLLKIRIKPTTNEGIYFTVDKSKIFLNTPDGSEAQIKNNSIILVNSASEMPTLGPDTYPPENFAPEIVTDPSIFDGKWAVVFSTVDKNSGMDHYEVMEASRAGGSGWITATSPYLLEDQSLGSDIFIRAVDKAGNFIVVKIPAKNVGPVNKSLTFALPILLLLIVLAAAWFIFKKKYAAKL